MSGNNNNQQEYNDDKYDQYDDNFQPTDNQQPSTIKQNQQSQQKSNKQKKIQNTHNKPTKKLTYSTLYKQSTKNKYTTEIQHKIQKTKITAKTSQQTIIKLNQQMKNMIKKYNNDLNEIIARNISMIEKNNKLYKKTDNQQHLKQSQNQTQITILKQEIDNNTKVQNILQQQLQNLQKKHQYYKNQQQKQNISQQNFDLSHQKHQQTQKLKQNIQNLKKYIHTLQKQTTKTNARKLQQKYQISIHPQTTSTMNTYQYNILKQKLCKQRQNYIRNQQYYGKIVIKQEELMHKIQEMKGDDGSRMANIKEDQKKYEKYYEINKKVSDVSNYKAKTVNLWEKKCSVLGKDNALLKREVKNMEAEISNLMSAGCQVENKICAVVEKFRQQKMEGQLDKNSKGIIEKLQKLGYLNDYNSNKASTAGTPIKKFSIRRSLGTANNSTKTQNQQQLQTFQTQIDQQPRIWTDPTQKQNENNKISNKQIEQKSSKSINNNIQNNNNNQNILSERTNKLSNKSINT